MTIKINLLQYYYLRRVHTYFNNNNTATITTTTTTTTTTITRTRMKSNCVIPFPNSTNESNGISPDSSKTPLAKLMVYKMDQNEQHSNIPNRGQIKVNHILTPFQQDNAQDDIYDSSSDDEKEKMNPEQSMNKSDLHNYHKKEEEYQKLYEEDSFSKIFEDILSFTDFDKTVSGILLRKNIIRGFQSAQETKQLMKSSSSNTTSIQFNKIVKWRETATALDLKFESFMLKLEELNSPATHEKGKRVRTTYKELVEDILVEFNISVTRYDELKLENIDSQLKIGYIKNTSSTVLETFRELRKDSDNKRAKDSEEKVMEQNAHSQAERKKIQAEKEKTENQKKQNSGWCSTQ